METVGAEVQSKSRPRKKKPSLSRGGKNKYDIYIMMRTVRYHYVRYAYSEKQALMRAVELIADEQGVMESLVWGYLRDNPKCYEIKSLGGKNGRIE